MRIPTLIEEPSSRKARRSRLLWLTRWRRPTHSEGSLTLDLGVNVTSPGFGHGTSSLAGWGSKVAEGPNPFGFVEAVLRHGGRPLALIGWGLSAPSCWPMFCMGRERGGSQSERLRRVSAAL